MWPASRGESSPGRNTHSTECGPSQARGPQYGIVLELDNFMEANEWGIPTILEKFQGIRPPPTFAPFMLGLGTVIAFCGGYVIWHADVLK